MSALVIRGASIADGSGAPAFLGDVRVRDGRIVEITRPGRLDGPGIDATGLVLAPGFVDMHSHSEARLTDPGFTAKSRQGVTCEVVGQDGLSFAPLDESTSDGVRELITGWHGSDVPAFPTVADYLAHFDTGSRANVAYLVPHGNIRAMAVGFDARRATPGELDAMRRLLAEGMRQGAFGLSTGLTYVPGMYADAAELTALCQTVASFGGFHDTHHRSYGAGALEAYAEMIEISRRSGCPLHLAHATMNFPPNRGRAPDLLALLDSALIEGLDLTFDTYPYLAGSTTLAALLPSWVASGGPSAILERLADPGLREKIAADLEVAGSDGCHGVPVDWDTIEVAGVAGDGQSWAVGRTIASLAAERGRPAFEVFTGLLRDDLLGTTIRQHVGDEDNVRAIMRHQAHTAGSDGLYPGAKPHPRAYGTFPRYLGHYVRELGVLSLEDCVAHLSGRPAHRLGLRDRGLVWTGHVADLVLFDPDTVADTATYDEPFGAPKGIPYVFVNGVAVVEDGRDTGELPGRALRHVPR
ncbi:D-aminoacylase [Phytomonospora sp. NPDC050363]|uniref:N-acyl-D-amino-acid deacylase family protein n=1 Tax=Phytomonospora sp. NPDC050363 TaxID=3155642 RepID=UPI0033CDBC97